MSRHFTLGEFLASSTAVAMKNPNLPTPEHRANLQATILGFEQARYILGGLPMRLTSGYRNPAVNRAVGGVPDSDHAEGRAGDFHHSVLSDYEAACRLRDSSLVFDQLIYERGRCVHLSFAPSLRRQVLSQHGGPGSRCVAGIVR